MLRLSQLFTKTSKEAVSDAASRNAELLVRGGFIHKTMAGVYSWLPLGLTVLRKIEQIVREEMNAIGGQEVLLSALAPKDVWEKTGRWDGLDVLFKVPGAGETEYALNPTHEELISPIAKQFVRSYRDLPFAAYQIQTKFRNEPRAKSGILRGREFLMKDLYSFHASQEDLDLYYVVVQGAYDRIFSRLDLTGLTYLTFASGGTFSKFSHEYQVLLPNGEDSIFISVKAEKEGRRIAVNKEIYEPGVTQCPVTGGTEFREEQASEAANIFKLGTKYSAPFELTFADAKGVQHDSIMGCYGIGVSRLMGIIAEAKSDDRGFRWPASVAPANVHIVPIGKSVDEESFAVARALAEDLEQRGQSVIIDDRTDATVGFKLADADLLGVPVRVIVSPKTLAQKSVEVTQRLTGETVLVPLQHAERVFDPRD